MRFFKNVWLTTGIIGIMIVAVWMYSTNDFYKIKQEDIINSYKNESYSGTGIDKYIDSESHNYHKLILTDNNIERIILFDFEQDGGLFDFAEKGDIIKKHSGTLKVNLKRKGLDTIIMIKIYGYNSEKDTLSY